MTTHSNKVVIVTGASAGIGKATAITFAKEGAKVALADVNEAGLHDVAGEILELGGDALVVVTDVADEAACQQLVEKTVAAYGKLDVIFNNAGISGQRYPLEETPTEEWHKVIGVNLNGVFFCTRAALSAMKNNGGGVIINTASVDGFIGMGSVSPYVATKHAVLGLTKNTALEYADQNIRCLAVCPGFIATAMTGDAFSKEEKEGLRQMVPLKRPAEPQEIANFVVWAASDQASYITGSSHVIDGALIAGISGK
ncbi:MAG: glucose 1-dehydrogenase [Amphritea sp.]